MGISLDQYRAVIGSWAAGRLKKTLPPPPPVQLTPNGAPDQQQSTFVLRGPWKLNSLILLFSLLTLLCHVPCRTNGHHHNATVVSHSGNVALSAADAPMAAGGCITRQCLAALLLISGIEPNPGPVSETRRQEELNILAGLCATAPQEVRDCLRLYEPRNTFTEHKLQFSGCNKPVLVATLDYLQIPDQDMYKKPKCVTNLICRIQNLLPDDCKLCGETYCVTLGEEPLLTCAICGQGTHNKCILNHFGIQPSEHDGFTTEDASTLVNPRSLPGVHYMCGACEESAIPDKKEGLLERYSTSSQDVTLLCSQQSQQNTTLPNHGADDTQEGDVEDGEQAEQTLPTSPHSQQLNQGSDPQEQLDSPPAWIQTQQHHPPRPQQVRQPQGKRQQDQPPPANQQQRQQQSGARRNICRFYRQGTCRHGIVGRNCPQEHPPPCKKLMKHGNRTPNGCTLGRECEYFHPKMCQSSLRKKECFNDDCKLKHITGTKRRPSPSSQDPGTSTNTSPSSTSDGNAFLEALQAMQADIMRAMDQRFAALQVVHPMAMGQMQPQMATTQAPRLHQTAQAWPVQGLPGQAYSMWPQGQAVDAHQHAQGAGTSTSQPMVLVQMPQAY